MYRRRCQWLCAFLILLIGVSGLWISESIGTNDSEKTDDTCRVLYLTAGDTFATDETACTTEMLGIHSSMELVRVPVLSDGLRRQAKASLVSSYDFIIPLDNRTPYRALRHTKGMLLSQGGQVVNYIHKSDGKKEPDIAYIQII